MKTVHIENKFKWFFMQIGQIAVAVFLGSLVFNYAYRFLIDWHENSALFYAATFILALIVYIVIRRDYIFITRYQFSHENIMVKTLFGIEANYSTSKYRFVPVLHKGVNFPEPKASLSFHIQDIQTNQNIRNYTWTGFSKNDFVEVSQMYGYAGETDYKMKDFGR